MFYVYGLFIECIKRLVIMLAFIAPPGEGGAMFYSPDSFQMFFINLGNSLIFQKSTGSLKQDSEKKIKKNVLSI